MESNLVLKKMRGVKTKYDPSKPIICENKIPGASSPPKTREAYMTKERTNKVKLLQM